MSRKTVMRRLPMDGDLLEELAALADRHDVDHGWIQVIGALKRAELGYYDQTTRTYHAHSVDKPVELLAGMGNISRKDGAPFIHLHLTLGDENGAALGGHALEGCVIFAAEALIRELDGPAPERVWDEPSGLFLWG